MEKRTTISAAVIAMAGILAEIIFRDIFYASLVGLILSIVLGVIILFLVYFAVDGIITAGRAREELEKEETPKGTGHAEEIYNALTEQIRLDRAIYQEVRSLKSLDEKWAHDAQEEREKIEGKTAPAHLFAETEAGAPAPVSVPTEVFRQLADELSYSVQQQMELLSDNLREFLAENAISEQSLEEQSEKLNESVQGFFADYAQSRAEQTETAIRENLEQYTQQEHERLSDELKQVIDECVEKLTEQLQETAENILSANGENKQDLFTQDAAQEIFAQQSERLENILQENCDTCAKLGQEKMSEDVRGQLAESAEQLLAQMQETENSTAGCTEQLRTQMQELADSLRAADKENETLQEDRVNYSTIVEYMKLIKSKLDELTAAGTGADTEKLEQLAEKINQTTVQSSKIIAGYLKENLPGKR